MKYKIIKKHSSSLRVERGLNGNPDKISVLKSIYYEAKRKGRIFGFWHTVGHEAYSDGELLPYVTNTLEEMKDYIQKWHEVRYGNNYKCEIIDYIDL